MLCNSCQKQRNCVPARLAQKDTTLAAMLERLKSCEVRPTPPPPQAWQTAIQRGWLWCWQRLKACRRRLTLPIN
ncbi:MAG TPA: hypothetical protein IGR64_17470 [Leptolyngbyaceae cyanobacterium M65_K2018_010]|nr:hypothetical protein [Leptolyngbyaceae cyanobacterium M65_K2018_010]